MESVEKLPQIAVTPATAGDAPGIQELMRASLLTTYVNEERGITREDIEERYKEEFTSEGLQRHREDLIKPEANLYQFVAKDGNTIVGYCRVRTGPDENLLARIHVLPDKKRTGIGALLWKQAQTVLNPTHDTALWVVDYNENARSVYKKWGFVETGISGTETLKSGAHRTSLKMLLPKTPVE